MGARETWQKGSAPKEGWSMEQPRAANRVSMGESFVGREDVLDQASKGGSLDRGGSEIRTMSGAERDGFPLPAVGGGGDRGHSLLRSVCPRAGSVLRHRRAYGLP